MKVLCLVLATMVLNQQVFAIVSPLSFLPKPAIDPLGLLLLAKPFILPAAIKKANFAVIGAGLAKGGVLGAGAGLAKKAALLGGGGILAAKAGAGLVGAKAAAITGAGLLAGKAGLGGLAALKAAGLGLGLAKAGLVLPAAVAAKGALLGGGLLAGKAGLLKVGALALPAHFAGKAGLLGLGGLGKAGLLAAGPLAAKGLILGGPLLLPKALLLKKGALLSGAGGFLNPFKLKLPGLAGLLPLANSPQPSVELPPFNEHESNPESGFGEVNFGPERSEPESYDQQPFVPQQQFEPQPQQTYEPVKGSSEGTYRNFY